MWAAVDSFTQDEESPYYWLCGMGLCSIGSEVITTADGTEQYNWPKWEQIRAEIERLGGPGFSVAALQKAAERAKLTLPQQETAS